MHLGNSLGERASSDVLAVEKNRDGVLSGIHSLVGYMVGTISSVLYLNIRNFARWSFDGNLNVFTTEGLVITSLVNRANGEVEVLDEGVSRPSSRLDVNVVGGSLDGLSVEGNGNVVSSGVLGLVGAVIGSVTVVLDVTRNRASWAVDLNNERISSLLHVVSVLVLSLDGEGGREGVEVSGLETRSISDGLGSICSRLDVDNLGGVAYVVEIDRVGWVALDDSNVVVSRVGRLVLNSPGTVVVISDFRSNQGKRRILNNNVEEVSTSCLGATISEGSVDGENLRLSSLVTILKTRSIGPALVGAGEGGGLTNVNSVRSLSDRLTVEGDLDNVISWVDGVVGAGVSSVLVVEDITRELLTIWVRDGNYVRVSSNRDQITKTVARLNGENSGGVALTTLQTRTISEALGGVRLGLVDVDTEGTGLDVLSIESNADSVGSSFASGVGNFVGSVTVVGSVGRELLTAGGSDLDRERVTTNRNASIGSISGFNGEVGLNTSLVSRFKTRTIGKALSGDGGALKELLLLATSFHIEVISVVGDVGHVGQLISFVDHIMRIQQHGDVHVVQSLLHTHTGITDRVVGEVSRKVLTGIRQNRLNRLTICPGRTASAKAQMALPLCQSLVKLLMLYSGILDLTHSKSSFLAELPSAT